MIKTRWAPEKKNASSQVAWTGDQHGTEVNGLSAERSRRENLSILCVDDTKVNRLLLGAVLESLGHRVDFGSNGREAVSMVMKGSYDLVLMDFQMPELDGIRATSMIRQLHPRIQTVTGRDLPIVIVTADPSSEARNASFDAGADGFLRKPLSLQDIRKTLVDYCQP